MRNGEKEWHHLGVKKFQAMPTNGGRDSPLLGVLFKISTKHPHPFLYGRPSSWDTEIPFLPKSIYNGKFFGKPGNVGMMMGLDHI